MRGGESIGAKTQPSLSREALPPSHTHPANSGSRSHKAPPGAFECGKQVDVTFLPGPAMLKHRRTPGSTSDHYVSYKRGMQNDVLKDNGNDVISRPPKMKVAKSKSDGSAADLTGPRYCSVASYGRLPKRSKASKKERTEKLSVSKLPKADALADRPLLGRRSRTFVIESRDPSLYGGSDSLQQNGGALQHGSSSRPKAESTKRPDNLHNASRDLERIVPMKEPVSKSKTSPKEIPSRRKSQWQAGKERGESRFSQWEAGIEKGESRFNQWQAGTERAESRLDQWEAEREAVREGARNPLCDRGASGLPPRPKSAGQLRYYDSDDSDESSMDGEIEIVDIDKELEDDSEPSPYWSQAQPLHIPEVFVHTSASCSSPPWKEGGRASVQHEHLHQQQQHPPLPPHPEQHAFLQQQHPPLPPHPEQHAFLQQQQPPWTSRKRHDSGESDMSALSDSLIKPAQSTGRKRIMSEPEILNLEQQRAAARRGGKTKKGAALLLDSRFADVDVIAPSDSCSVSVASERLYSDTMERVLSRYSELGLRETRDDVSGKGRSSRIPVVTNATASGSRISASGHMVPPRKLKPILKQARSDTNTSTSS